MFTLEGEGMKKKTTKNKIIAFIYLLLMDEVSAEKLESIMEDLRGSPGKVFEMGNEYLASYAEDMAKRLTESE